MLERAIGRIKEYHILQGILPAAMWDTINQVVFVCCMLSNFSTFGVEQHRQFQ